MPLALDQANTRLRERSRDATKITEDISAGGELGNELA